jgi:quercetin dioxygenase-like cupin family protein
MSDPMKRTILERFDVPGSSYETVMMFVEISPGVNSGLHTHPGFDAAYLLEGDLVVLERGQPEKAIHPGQSWHVRPGIVHEVKVGDRTAKVLATYVVEKGKPLATPWSPAGSLQP